MSTENNNGQESGDQIGPGGKRAAGILLVLSTVAAILMLIAYWPNKIPAPGSKCSTYRYTCFHIQLLDSASCSCVMAYGSSTCPVEKDTAATKTAADTSKQKPAAADSTDTMKAGSAPIDTSHKNKQPQVVKATALCDTIQLDTILLILVATAGFLGNMIHVATSFTTFIGNGEFKRNWVLWYFVKPFTAAGLAVVFYFVFRAGLLNAADSGGSINIYGLMSLSCLTGLFTDIATLKLKEVFTAMFKPKEERRDALNPVPKVTEVTPASLDATTANAITIKGEDLDKGTLSVMMDNVAVTGTAVTATAITFSYTLNAQQQTQTTVKLVVNDGQGKQVYTLNIPVKAAQPAPSISVQPTTISAATANDMIITGQGFEDTVSVTIGDTLVNAPQVTPTAISFSYSVPPELAGKTTLPLKITDVNGTVLYSTILTVQP